MDNALLKTTYTCVCKVKGGFQYDKHVFLKGEHQNLHQLTAKLVSIVPSGKKCRYATESNSFHENPCLP